MALDKTALIAAGKEGAKTAGWAAAGIALAAVALRFLGLNLNLTKARR